MSKTVEPDPSRSKEFAQALSDIFADLVSGKLSDPPEWESKEKVWIPHPDDSSSHPRRTLVLCFDGTGNRFDDVNSNVVEFVSMLKKDDCSKQMVYYQTGIGTWGGEESGRSQSPLRNISKAVDLMFGVTIGSHIRDGYEFLCQNYQQGDAICIFGFSRGAYAARSLAGMIEKVGVLPPWNRKMVPFAYGLYSKHDWNEIGFFQDFKKTFSVEARIDFVGVWDTVSSIGLIPRFLPFVTNNSSIRYFRHALSLDEHRAKFAPSYYHKIKSEDLVKVQISNGGLGQLVPNDTTPENIGNQPNREDQQNEDKRTNALEVWFAGVHADVGGGSVHRGARHSLARIPLRWMIRECFRCSTGIIFDGDLLEREAGMDIYKGKNNNYKVREAPKRVPPSEGDSISDQGKYDAYKSRAQDLILLFTLSALIISPLTLVLILLIFPTKLAEKVFSLFRPKDETATGFLGEAEEELLDALAPAYDQLQLSPYWWFLEWIPLRSKKENTQYYTGSKKSTYSWSVNRGMGRQVDDHIVHRPLKVHRSVLTRVEASNRNGRAEAYIPRIRPSIVIEKDEEKRIPARRMSNKEWKTQKVEHEGRRYQWFDWV